MCSNQTRLGVERAPSVRHEHLVVAMPYAPGIGLAWNYIERVTADLTRGLTDRGGRSTVAHPIVAGDARGNPGGAQIVARMFYRTSPAHTFDNARWLRRHGVTHLYFAEHIAFDWRYAIYRAVAGVRIIVHYHHAGGRREPYTGLARMIRGLRAALRPMVADRAICVSEFIRRRVVTLARVPVSRCVVVHNAVLEDKRLPPAVRAQRRHAFRAGLEIADDAVVVVCGARAAMEKGIDVLFAAFNVLCQELHTRNQPMPWLLHAGDGPDFDALNALRGSLSHASQMRMLGRLSDMQDA